ncbi:MAG: FAD-dependent oxidoreductase [Polyangiaceae bacterium]|nr:FAD-dependent oxidoreductase [Polyangiaceae bacterium]
MRRLEADVCVVGAGFSGLMAARRLSEAGKHVIVLEARDRVGGRVHTVTEAGAVLDLGGQWVGPTQDRLNGFAAEIGARTFVTYGEGSHLYASRSPAGASGKPKRFKGTIPPLDPWSLAWLGYGWAELDRRAKKVPLDAPWTAPRAREWDGQTVASFLDRHVRAEPARRMFRIAIEAVFACDPEDLSLLHALFYIHSAGKLDLLLSTDAGAQRDRFVNGMQPVAEELAKRVKGEIVQGAAVRSISQDASSVVVVASTVSVRAKRAVVAIPPTLAGRIDYSPALPADRDQLHAARPARVRHQVPRGVRRALLAQAVAHRPVDLRGRALPPHVRRVPRVGLSRCAARLRRGRRSARSRPPAARRAAHLRARVLRACVRRARAEARALRRQIVGGRALLPGLLRGLSASRRVDEPRQRAARPDWTPALGRHRDRDALERLHRWRARVRRQGRDRDPEGRALTCATRWSRCAGARCSSRRTRIEIRTRGKV